MKSAMELKRNNLTFRARDGLRNELKAAAEANGRSMSEEIEFRLEQSFDRAAVARLVASLILVDERR